MLQSLAVSSFAIAFFHAALPTHWLPFVITARTQHWSRFTALGVVVLAATAHVLTTTALGILVVWFGFELSGAIGDMFSLVAGGALIGFGSYYLIRQIKGGHSCSAQAVKIRPTRDSQGRSGPEADRIGCQAIRLNSTAPLTGTQARPGGAQGGRIAVFGLVTTLALSPCGAFLPVYFSGLGFGWSGFLILTMVLSFATILAMTTFTWFALLGFEKLSFGRLERWECGLTGLILCALGVYVATAAHAGH